jgi:hypothetical protein
MATTAVGPGTIKVAQNYKPGAGIQVVKREIPEHRPGQVRLSSVTNEEKSLLARSRAGDTAAFASLVMPHRESILRRIQRILQNREDAEDAVQTAIRVSQEENRERPWKIQHHSGQLTRNSPLLWGSPHRGLHQPLV